MCPRKPLAVRPAGHSFRTFYTRRPHEKPSRPGHGKKLLWINATVVGSLGCALARLGQDEREQPRAPGRHAQSWRWLADQERLRSSDKFTVLWTTRSCARTSWKS